MSTLTTCFLLKLFVKNVLSHLARTLTARVGPANRRHTIMTRRLPRLASVLSAALVLFALVSAPRPARAEGRIAVVDLQQALLQTEDGKNAQDRLKKLFDKRQKEIEGQQEELQKAREDIDRQTRVLSREAIGRRVEDWQRRMIDLQQRFVDYQKELQKKQSELTSPIFKKMSSIIKRLAKKNGYDLVIDGTAVHFVRSDLDLTDQVIQIYNAGGSGGDDAPAEPSDKPAAGGEEKKAP